MRRLLPILLLVLGMSIAGAGGARNGPSHTAYRAALQAGAPVTPPPPGQRLVEWAQVGGPAWLVGLALIVVGAVMARRQRAAEHSGEGIEASDAVDFPGTLQAVLAELSQVADAIAELPYDDDAAEARAAIDRVVGEHLEPVVEGRGQLVARHGLSTFAGYFGLFAAGERNLARCWSALTDGHAGVARQALEASQEAFQAALDAWHKAEGTAPGAASSPEARLA